MTKQQFSFLRYPDIIAAARNRKLCLGAGDERSQNRVGMLWSLAVHVCCVITALSVCSS